MSAEGCPHYTIIRIKTREEPKDPVAAPRICLKCGEMFIIYPVNLSDNPGLKEMLQQAAKDTTANIQKL